jgi:hypothetical protein
VNASFALILLLLTQTEATGSQSVPESEAQAEQSSGNAETPPPGAEGSINSPAAEAEAEPEPEPTAAPGLQVTTTGYLDSRFPLQHPRSDTLSPMRAPAYSNLTEGNLQLKLAFSERTAAYTDTSLFWQWAYLKANGVRYDSALYRPQAVVSELYVGSEVVPHLHLTLGKKRVVWGPGMAQNPMDFLNPPKDPTNPTGQRAGAWLGRIELPYDQFTLSFVGAAKVVRQYAGLPTAMIWYPDYPTAEAAAGQLPDDRDKQPHFAFASRLYLLVEDTDVNFVWGFTNAYNDRFLHKNRGGFSLSRTFGAWELHTEVLAQTGYSNLWPDGACVSTPLDVATCMASGTPVAAARTGNKTFTPKALLGARYQFEDNALFSAEYYFNGEGLTRDAFTDYVNLLYSARTLVLADPQTLSSFTTLLGSNPDPGSPQRFTFEPLRRHYLFLSYSKPQLWNDFTLGASLVSSLTDFSGQVAPFVTWAPKEWLSLNLTTYVALPAVSSLAVDVNGTRYGEFSLGPSDVSVQLSGRAYF